MATLILTVLGTAIGGPIGGAIGALAGQAVDAQIFRPPGRQGPRLSDLRVQTSTYGAQMPKLFGRMRVAGSVIWATDLVERSETSGGKGRPKVTSFTYSASFAVALSSRPIRRVGRIWADGNLLRGAQGDFKTGLSAFRLHTGAPDQEADPLMIGDRGVALTPACRDCAYAVFEDLQLADFGNRIPSLTFEVFADDGLVPVSAIVADLPIDGVVDARHAGQEAEPVLDGYAASGLRAADAIAPILEAHGLSVRTVDASVILSSGDLSTVQLDLAQDVRSARKNGGAPRQEDRSDAARAARRHVIRYYDPDRDYQSGLQSVDGEPSALAEDVIDLPAVLPASHARQIVTQSARRKARGRRSIVVQRGWADLLLRPGDLVGIGNASGLWRIETTEWESMVVRLTARAFPSSVFDRLPASDSGAAVRQNDVAAGPTHLALVELPQTGDTPVDSAQVVVAASGDSAAWRPAALFLKDAVSGGFDPLGVSQRAAALGVAVSVLPAGSGRLIDEASAVTVVLHDGSQTLSSATDRALLNGANACMLGQELLQFGTAVQIGPRTFRLGRLLRGRRGTDGAINRHQSGEMFLLLRGETLFPVDPATAPAGRTVNIAAQGIGDQSLVETELTVSGLAQLPLSPVHLTAKGDGAGGLMIEWIRRSRLGWQWSDGAETPLGEEREAYEVTLTANGVRLRGGATDAPPWAYDAGAIASDLGLAAGHPIRFTVRQRGTHGLGPPATFDLPLP